MNRNARWLLVGGALWCALLWAGPVFARAEYPAIPLPEAEVRERLEKAAGMTWEGVDRVVVFRGSDVKVEDSGLTRRIEYSIVRVVTPAGGRDAGSLRLDYDPATSDATFDSVRVFRKSGAVEEIPVAQAKDLPVPMHGIYWPMRMRLLGLPALEPGDSVVWSVRRVGFQMGYLGAEGEERFIPPQRGEFYEIFQFGDSIPVMEQWFLVSCPQGKPAQVGVYNGEVTSRQVLRDGKMHYRFWRQALPPYPAQPNSLAMSDSAPKVVLVSLPSWQEKSRWFYSVSEPSFFYTPEIEAKAQEIVAGLTTDQQKAEALNRWVANNVRYSGLTMGEGEGYTIHPATMTFHDRMGVCKDKAGMLVTLMRAAGLKETYAAMTMAGSRVENLPADQFNHAVVAWRKPGGEFVLLDPTWAPLSREVWSYAEAEQHYLIGTPQGEDLAITPPLQPEDNPLRVKLESRVDQEGTLRVTAAISADGFSETCLRRWFGYRPRSTWNEILLGMARKVGPTARLLGSSLKESDPEELSRPFAMSLDFDVPGFLPMPAAPLQAVMPAAFSFLVNEDRLMENLTVTGLSARNRGLAFRTAKRLEYEETLEFPWPVELGSDPTTHLKTDFGEVSVEARAEGKRVYLHLVARFTTRSVPLAGIPEYGKLLSAVQKLRTTRLVVVRGKP